MIFKKVGSLSRSFVINQQQNNIFGTKSCISSFCISCLF